MMRKYFTPTLLVAAIAALGCSKGSDTSSTTASDSAAAATPTTSSTSDSANAPLRGTLASLNDTSVTVSLRNGNVTVPIASPFTVYARVPGKLGDVKSNSFVGVTSVAQADGSQRATEIHIFPEQLRGMGEGSRPMGRPSGVTGGSSNTMTNGTVSGSQMTNGTASTMTNGTISGKQGGILTVQYQGGTQTITVPANVTVTTIAPTQAKPAPGANVVVLRSKQPDGSVKASAIMLSAGGGRRR